jgi:phytoene synthase
LAEDDAEDDLDQLIRRVDPDRWLASRFIADAAARTDVVALYAFDHELARAHRAASTSLLAEIRLAWWREALDEIFAGARPVRRHPVVEALATAIRGRNLLRAPFDVMVEGQIEALDLELGPAEALAWADAVEGSLAVLAAQALDPAAPADAARPAGRAWGLALLRRAGKATPGVVDSLLREALAEARAAARRLSVAALPAALPARLARADLAGRGPGQLGKQLSLVLGAATGRV